MGLTYFFREMAAPETRATTARAAATPTTSLAPVPGLVVVPGVAGVSVAVAVTLSVVTMKVDRAGTLKVKTPRSRVAANLVILPDRSLA